MITCFLSTPQYTHHKFCSSIRVLGWLSFPVCVVIIGQATLIVRMIIVALTFLATILTARGTGSDLTEGGDGLRSSTGRMSQPVGTAHWGLKRIGLLA